MQSDCTITTTFPYQPCRKDVASGGRKLDQLLMNLKLRSVIFWFLPLALRKWEGFSSWPRNICEEVKMQWGRRRGGEERRGWEDREGEGGRGWCINMLRNILRCISVSPDGWSVWNKSVLDRGLIWAACQPDPLLRPMLSVCRHFCQCICLWDASTNLHIQLTHTHTLTSHL